MHTRRPVHSRAAAIFEEDHSGSMQGCGAVPAAAVREKLANQGVDPMAMGAAEFQTFVNAEEVSMATLAKVLNLTPQ
jgi:hypothetical protein